MKKYELMLILPPDIGEDKTKKELDEIRKFIKDEKGEILSEDLWGVREFAYTIKKYDEGFYAVIDFHIDPKQIAELEKFLNLQQKVLRFITIKIPESYTMRTLEEYKKEEETEAKKEREEKEKQEQEKEVKRSVKRTVKPKEEAPRKEKVYVKKEESADDKPKKEAPKEEESVMKAPKKEEKEEEVEKKEAKEEAKEEPKKKEEFDPIKTDLKDVDEKLRSIIDDPDISL